VIPKHKVYSSYSEAIRHNEFTDREGFLIGEPQVPMTATIYIDGYVFDRLNHIKYNTRRRKNKPTKLSYTEYVLCVRLIEKQMELNKVKQIVGGEPQGKP